MTPAIVLIAAVARNGVIGDKGRMPWRLPGDLRHFRAATFGKAVIMGRKTLAAIGRPLPDRYNIVLSRDPVFACEGVTVVSDFAAAIAAGETRFEAQSGSGIMVIGGASVYAEAMPQAERLLITRVDLSPDGDTVFPAIDPDLWRMESRSPPQQQRDDEASYGFESYIRSSSSTG